MSGYPLLVTPAECLEEVRGLTLANRWRLSKHAVKRLDERGARPQDVRHGLINATGAAPADAGCWKLATLDRDGDDLTLVVAIRDRVLVVTLY